MTLFFNIVLDTLFIVGIIIYIERFDYTVLLCQMWGVMQVPLKSKLIFQD